MAASFLRVLRLWVAFLAVFSAAAAPASSAGARVRPAVSSVLLEERQVCQGSALAAELGVALTWSAAPAGEPPVRRPGEPRAARGRLFVKHRALLW